MQPYSVGVAVFDYLPVLLTAAGLGLLARGISYRNQSLAVVAWTAAALIPLGGLCKASWKLLLALGYPPLDWLENLLFIALAPGFVAMAFALHHARRAWATKQEPVGATYPRMRLLLWLAIPVVGALLAVTAKPDGRLWFLWLLAVTIIASVALMVQAIWAARWARMAWPTIACFAYNLAASLSLGGLARLPPGEATAWIQEGVNLSAQLALLLGAWQLQRRMCAPQH